MDPKEEGEQGGAKTVKLVIQQCLSARLKPPPNEEEGDFGDRSIREGMVVFVCFSKGATEAAAIRAAEATSRLKLCEPPEVEKESEARYTETTQVPPSRRKRMSVLERRGDVLVVPQATLGAKLKGKGRGNNSLQYHGNVDKADGERLFAAFCAALKSLVEENDAGEVPESQGSQGSQGPRVVGGVYGARQRLTMDTDGPYTHILQL